MINKILIVCPRSKTIRKHYFRLHYRCVSQLSILFDLTIFSTGFFLQNKSSNTTATAPHYTSNYRLFGLPVALVTSSALQCTSSSTALALVVTNIGTNRYSNHGNARPINFCASITTSHIEGENERRTLFAAYGCVGCDDQINPISVTVFIMNNVINQIVYPVCRCRRSSARRCDELFSLIFSVIRRKGSYGLNVSSVRDHANRIHRRGQSTKALRPPVVGHGNSGICDGCQSTGPWRQRSDQISIIISFNPQSIRDGRTSDDAMMACRMRQIIQQLICNLCDNFLTIKLTESVPLNTSDELMKHFDLNLNSNLLIRWAAAVAANDKMLVYSMICTKHCRRRRGRRRPYLTKCAPPGPNERQLQQMVQWCCHADADSARRCSCSSINTNPSNDVFMCPVSVRNNNNSIYCQQPYLNGRPSPAKPLANSVSDGDPVSLPRSVLKDCNDQHRHLRMMKSIEWTNKAKLRSINARNAIVAVDTSSPSSTPNGPLSGVTLLSISSNAHEFEQNATVSTLDAATATTTTTIPSSALELQPRNATKTPTMLAANRRICRINSPRRTRQARCCPATSAASSPGPNRSGPTSTTSTTYLKRHLYLLLIAFLTCCAPFASATSMHNMKYSTNVVKTKYGQLRGIVVRSNPTVEAYLGVPYATPPVGSLR